MFGRNFYPEAVLWSTTNQRLAYDDGLLAHDVQVIVVVGRGEMGGVT